MDRPTKILSGIRPTGKIHLGNYLGAIKQIVDLQQQNECLFFVADLHALTTADERFDVDSNVIEVVRSYLACGVDPEKSIIYRQSDVPQIPYLASLLNMITPDGLLRRCTTFKDKAAKQQTVSAGLLTYPVLMAADILIMEADVVPVGEDQLQHLEIARDIAQKFNFHFADVLTLPRAREMEAIRVPGLDGSGKMGKSDGNTIDLIEDPKSVMKKVKSAVTDMGPVEGEPMPESMENLYYLMKMISSADTYAHYKDMYDRCEQKFYGGMKKQLAEDMVALLEPIRERYHSPECSEERVREILDANVAKVLPTAERVLDNVQRGFGLRK